MLFNQLDILVKYEQQKDLLREAEAERLARLAFVPHPKVTDLGRRALFALGRGLAAAGAALEKQYRDYENAPANIAEHQGAD